MKWLKNENPVFALGIRAGSVHVSIPFSSTHRLLTSPSSALNVYATPDDKVILFISEVQCYALSKNVMLRLSNHFHFFIHYLCYPACYPLHFALHFLWRDCIIYEHL